MTTENAFDLLQEMNTQLSIVTFKDYWACSNDPGTPFSHSTPTRHLKDTVIKLMSSTFLHVLKVWLKRCVKCWSNRSRYSKTAGDAALQLTAFVLCWLSGNRESCWASGSPDCCGVSGGSVCVFPRGLTERGPMGAVTVSLWSATASGTAAREGRLKLSYSGTVEQRFLDPISNWPKDN